MSACKWWPGIRGFSRLCSSLRRGKEGGIERIVDVARAWIIAHQGWAYPGLLLPNLEIFFFFFFFNSHKSLALPSISNTTHESDISVT
jgi:hypothetical protein